MAQNEDIAFVKNESELERILAAKKYLVVNFTASWCGPCQASKPVVDGLYKEDKYKKIEIVRVDLDQNQQLAQKYMVTSVPTFLFIQDKKEVERVQGFSQQFQVALSKLNAIAETDSSVKSRTEQTGTLESGTGSEYKKEIQGLVPKGFEVINSAIHFGEMVALNVMPLYKESSGVKLLFKPLSEASTIFTDSDSQALFFVPLNHICKVYSILVKILKPEASDSTELDAEEIEESQIPRVIKVWANKPAVLSFEDCTASDALHEEQLESNLEPGWHEIKLRYVRFQNVQNLNIFVDGDDEYKHTVIEKVIIVGLTGESTEHIAILQEEQ